MGRNPYGKETQTNRRIEELFLESQSGSRAQHLQNRYRRLNGARGPAARHREGTGGRIYYQCGNDLLIVRSGARVEVADR
jgi:hypothetical protein